MPSTFGTEYTEETDGGGTARTSQLKLRPGETVEQAQQRVQKEKELKRIEKLLKLSYPRQRELHMYRKRFGRNASPIQFNTSNDLLQYKKTQKKHQLLQSSSNVQSRETFAGTSGNQSPRKVQNRLDNLYAGNSCESNSVESMNRSDLTQSKVKKILFMSRKQSDKRSVSNNSGNTDNQVNVVPSTGDHSKDRDTLS